MTADYESCGYLIRTDLLWWARPLHGARWPPGRAEPRSDVPHDSDRPTSTAAGFIAFGGTPVAARKATQTEVEVRWPCIRTLGFADLELTLSYFAILVLPLFRETVRR